jgi:membrane associated rhomboid family serine protease
VPGRYQFSLPERPQRDGWFRIGSLDVTTTALLVILNVASMFWYAIDKASQFNLVFFGILVREGDVWRLVTWPLYAEPTIWTAITLVFFWFVGHQIEDRVGRKRYAILISAMVVIPAILVTLLQLEPDKGVDGLNLLALALLVVYALDNPSATAWFGVPIWVFAAVYVGLMILQYIGNGMYEALVMGIAVILMALGGARQFGMLDDLGFIPRVGAGTGGGSAPKRSKPARSAKQKGGDVVAGPWAPPAPQHSAIEELEMNQLLDKISAGGIDSLSRTEKARLNELSKKLRGR